MGKLENNTKSRKVNKITSAILVSTMAFTAAALGLSNFSSGEEYILQGASRPALVSAIQAENGVIIHEFKLIQAVSAKLTNEQVQGIASRNAMIRFFNEDNQLSLSAAKDAGLAESRVISKSAPRSSQIPQQVGANQLHKEGITGKGVTVAIIDSGLAQFSALQRNTAGQERNITVVDALGKDAADSQDLNGHGSHIASILADSSSVFDQYGAPTGAHSGVAPDVDLVMIKAFDEQGKASYSSVLKGIEYAIDNKDSLNIRVLNVAFSFPATSFYWEDPINQALMRAWDNGITVIAPAGNGNNKDMSIGVPGNNPYVITVGAMDDNSTPFDTSDDVVASFSSFGPTLEGFMKPEVLAPGANVKGLVAKNSRLAGKNKKSGISGTSQATAVTAGVVALMIQQDPSLTPDEIKCRLMSSASQATKQNGELAFSRFAQGAGLINASAAINATIVGCANNGLDIFSDINLRNSFVDLNAAEGEGIFANGVIWNNDGVIWNNDSEKVAEPGREGVIWNNDGVIWNNDSEKVVEPGKEGVIWNNDGVIWNNDSEKVVEPGKEGVIWNNDGVIWNNDSEKVVEPRKEGVIWNNDGVIWNNDSEKVVEPGKEGVIWNNDGVIWNNDSEKVVEPGKEGVIWNNDGVIWNNDSEKAAEPGKEGVIWNNDGVIWSNASEKEAEPEKEAVIWNNDGEKVAEPGKEGVIWNNDGFKKLSNLIM